MKKSFKTLITGMAALTLFSTPIYADSVKEQVTELKEILPNILTTHEIMYKTLKGKDYVYNVDASTSNDLEFKVYKDGVGSDSYEFTDRGYDGTLDVYVGSKGFEFTPENTSPEDWKKLEAKYDKFVGKILSLAKKVLEERSFSLDIDLEEM